MELLMLKSFKIFLLEKQEGMLDISIPSFFKFLKLDPSKITPGSKAEASANEKIKTTLTGNFKIQEKVDGVKLSIIRNNTPYNPTDYTQNWIVSYKTFILYPFEHTDVPTSEVEHASNYGNSQYKLIHEQLRKAHVKLKDIPENTEFFLEYLMKKSTLTRTYGSKHTRQVIFLASSPTTFVIHQGKVTTQSTHFNTDLENNTNKLFIEATGFLPPKEIFVGSLFRNWDTTPQFNISSITFNKLAQRYHDLEPAFSDAIQHNNWISVAVILQELFTTFPSFYGGGVPEGVVCWKEGLETPFKFVSSEQYNKELRKNIKTELVGDSKQNELYFAAIEQKAEELLKKIDLTNSLEDNIKQAAKLVYHQNLSTLDPDNKQKTNLNKQDDLFLKLKGYLIDILNPAANSVVNRKLGETSGLGLIVGKFRLPTIAHLELIKLALKHNPKVLLSLVTTKKKGLSFSDRKDILENSFPGKVIVTEVDSANLSRIFTAFKGKISQVFCGTDAVEAYKKQVELYNQQQGTDIKVIELSRAEDDEISATTLEKAIKERDSETFTRFAAPRLKPYWESLTSIIT